MKNLKEQGLNKLITLTCPLKDLVIHFDAHFKSRKLSPVRLHALELDVGKEFVEEHHGTLFRADEFLFSGIYS